MLLKTDTANMFVFTLYIFANNRNLSCVRFFRWKEKKKKNNNFMLVLCLSMQVSHHIKGKIMKTTKHKPLSIFKTLLDTILVLGKTFYSTIQWTDWRRYKTLEKTSLTVKANTMSQGIKNAVRRKTHKPSNYL